MVAGFSPRVLAIANNEHLLDWVEVLPQDASDLVLPHGGRDGETEDARNRNELPRVRFKRCNNAIELFLCRPAIALISLSDQIQARQRNACENDGLQSIRRSSSIAHPSASLRRRNVSLTYFPFRRT